MRELSVYHRRTRERGVNAPVYWIARAVLQPAIQLWFRVRRERREHVPAEGPVIVASNHRSFLDPFVIGCCADGLSTSWRSASSSRSAGWHGC